MESIIKSAWFWLLVAAIAILLVILMVGSGMRKISGWLWFLYILAIIIAVVGIVLASVQWYYQDKGILEEPDYFVSQSMVKENPYVIPVIPVTREKRVAAPQVPQYSQIPQISQDSPQMAPSISVNSPVNVPAARFSQQDDFIPPVSQIAPRSSRPVLPLPNNATMVRSRPSVIPSSPSVQASRVANNIPQAQRGFVPSGLDLSALSSN